MTNTHLSFAPARWLGAPAPGGLGLPDAKPTAAQVYGPRGVCLTERGLIVADSGNHRVLIWQRWPEHDHAPADVVLGQPDFTREGPAAGGRSVERGLYLPTGLAVIDGRLFVADAWHHRLLIWNRVPEVSYAPPDQVLGQPDRHSVQENQGGAARADTFYWPFGLAWIHGWFYVTDTGNRRVLAWHGVPEPGQPADVILGQDTPGLALENRGGPVAANSFRWPHAIAGDGQRLFVADAGNHRVLAWDGPAPADRPADLVLGQPDFLSAREFAYVKQGPTRLRFPYSLALDGDLLAVADTANNRVLLYADASAIPSGASAGAVLGQPDFDANGENHWKAVTHHSLCWPYGLDLRDGRLAIADSGNNRVMVWQRTG